ncbi:MAG: 3'-5' exonuclease, partial [Sutterella wadsworthensis]
RAGAAAALSAFIDEEHLAERLLPVEGGEQRLTNYAHIIELLNEAGRKYATPAGLLSWFESARAQKGGETRNLRLASDANLVTVETIHSSKGLQYPIVYLPSAESMAVMKGEKRSVFKQSDASGMELSITHGEVQESDALKVKRKEELVRLAYVAMTRAACRLVLVVPQNRTSTGWHGNYRKNAYFMALTGSLEPDRDIVLDSFRELGSLPGVRCVEIETLLTETADDITVAPPALDTDLGVDHAKPILPKWRVSSFSSINRSVTDDEVAWFGPKQSAGPLEGILAFPRGTKAGDAMHGMLEIADFPAVAPDTPEADALRRSIARSRIEQFLSFPDEASL